MTLTQMQVLSTYAHQMQTGNKYYTKPAPDTMVDILGKVHHHKIARRTFFEATHDLEADGYIRRQVRYHPKAKPKIIQLPSLVLFRLKGVKYLMGLGIAYAYKLYKQMTDFLKHFQSLVPESVEKYNERTLELIDDEYHLKKCREVLLMLEAYEKEKRRNRPLRLK